ncbi:hypothetical protein CIK76_13105 [Glutamicibacter sp. BW80]|nr:hypothetical protein CIK76_13105 [Glutamicibacter sp. BW80]
MSRFVGERPGQVPGPGVFGDDLTEPFVPVMPFAALRHGVQVAGPQHLQWWFLPPDSGGEHRVVLDVDGKQHNSIGDTASPTLYSEMAAEDTLPSRAGGFSRSPRTHARAGRYGALD